MRLLYTIGIYLYGAGIRLASLFDPRAAEWTRGRKKLSHKLEKFGKRDTGRKVIWFHCASLGEFEQGRPVIERFREKNPGWEIVLTFFSPSGYKIRKDYPHADAVFYLPLDTPGKVRKFIRTVRPSIAVFVKYEFWFNFIHYLSGKSIPVYTISAIFRDDQHFFRPSGLWQAKQLKKISHFFVQDERSKQLLESIGINRVSVSGDTRFDRVAQVTRAAEEFGNVGSFIAGRKVLLAGSTWPADEEKIIPLLDDHPEMALIIAPHEIHEGRITGLMKALKGKKVARYTKPVPDNESEANVLLIDTIGILSQLYRYADIAYIGGGFGTGIHNILEAAAYGKPVIFGPNYHKFKEAREMAEAGGAFPVSEAKELRKVVSELLSDDEKYSAAARASSGYVESRTGATEMILEKMVGG